MGRSSFSRWVDLLLGRLVAFVPTATPVALLLLNNLLELVGAAHVTVGWQVEALAFTMFAGRFLREGLASGSLVKEIAAGKADYDRFLTSAYQATPVGPYAPGKGIPWVASTPAVPPPGRQVPPHPSAADFASDPRA